MTMTTTLISPRQLRVRRRRLVLGLGALPLAMAPAARAAIGGLPSNTGHTDVSPEWELLRGRLFGTRAIDAGSGRVQLTPPAHVGRRRAVTARLPRRVGRPR